MDLLIDIETRIIMAFAVSDIKCIRIILKWMTEFMDELVQLVIPSSSAGVLLPP